MLKLFLCFDFIMKASYHKFLLPVKKLLDHLRGNSSRTNYMGANPEFPAFFSDDFCQTNHSMLACSVGSLVRVALDSYN